jgi:hypothetical protein
VNKLPPAVESHLIALPSSRGGAMAGGRTLDHGHTVHREVATRSRRRSAAVRCER